MTGESGGYPLCMIDMKDLWRSYRKQPALSGFSGEIELERGLIYGLIGPNGSGKTTLLKLLAGILFPSGGRIFRKGEGLEKKNCAEQEASFPALRSSSGPSGGNPVPWTEEESFVAVRAAHPSAVLPSAGQHPPAFSGIRSSACSGSPAHRLFPGGWRLPVFLPPPLSAMSGRHVRHGTDRGRRLSAREKNGQSDLPDPDRPALCHQYAYSHRSGSPVSDPLLLRHRHRPPSLSVRVRLRWRLGRIPSYQSGLVPFGKRCFRALHETGTKNRSMGYLLRPTENIRSPALPPASV